MRNSVATLSLSAVPRCLPVTDRRAAGQPGRTTTLIGTPGQVHIFIRRVSATECKHLDRDGKRRSEMRNEGVGVERGCEG